MANKNVLYFKITPTSFIFNLSTSNLTILFISLTVNILLRSFLGGLGWREKTDPKESSSEPNPL